MVPVYIDIIGIHTQTDLYLWLVFMVYFFFFFYLCIIILFRSLQEQIRQRKEEEDRLAKQNEFLKGSLRGSKKLQALESHPPTTGIVNDAYSDEEPVDDGSAEVVHKFICKYNSLKIKFLY